MQENNQFSASERFYREALDDYRQLAEDNPVVYRLYVAMTLINPENLVAGDSGRRDKSEQLL
ncbi:MAG: hypothetical protein ACU843_01100 [Gammaproteobacteria bacterium]